MVRDAQPPSQDRVRGASLGLPASGPGALASFGTRVLAFLVDAIAAGLLAAAAALMETEQGKRAVKSVGDNVDDAAEAAARKASRVKAAVKAAAGAMGNRILDEVKSSVAKTGKKGAG